MTPSIVDNFTEILEEKEKANRQLRAKLNQKAFRSAPERDKRIIELNNQGVSKRRIAKLVGLTPFGVTKALRRLGTNSG